MTINFITVNSQGVVIIDAHKAGLATPVGHIDTPGCTTAVICKVRGDVKMVRR